MSAPKNPTIPVVHGTANAQTITGNANSATYALLQYVTLSANYARAVPAGEPDPNAGCEVKKSKTSAAQTILSGTRFQCFSHEAAALVAAGAGSLS